jgi:hypothetical protein
MKKTKKAGLGCLVVAISCLMSIGSVFAQQAQPDVAPVQGSQPLQVEIVEGDQVIQQVSSLQNEMIGYIDWDNNVVYAVGDGVPPQDAVSPAQARLRAKRAAIDEAMARLLEAIKEVRVDAESTTRNFINENRTVHTRVSGMIKNAEIIELRQAEDGSYQIKMKMPIHGTKGISIALLPVEMNKVAKVSIVTRVVRQEPAQTKITVSPQSTNIKVTSKQPKQGTAEPETSAPAPKEAPLFTGLIIDATGLNASPALYPSVKTESGKVIYNLTIADPNTTIEDGLCTYKKSLDQAKKAPRVGNNPLIVKAVGVGGKQKVDVIVADQDGEGIVQADLQTAFLKEANVVVVVD